MFKIGEFSKLTQVTVRMLRYYDEIDLLKPSKIDENNGYRLYAIDQVPELQKILMLRDARFSINEIKDIMNNWDKDTLINHLEDKVKEIEKNIAIEKKRSLDIQKSISDIKESDDEFHYAVKIKQIPAMNVLSLRRIVPDFYAEGILWADIYKYIEEHHIELMPGTEGNIAIYHDSEYRDDGVDIEVCVHVKRLDKSNSTFKFYELPEVEYMASMMVYGPYSNIKQAFYSFFYWLKKHDEYEMKGLSRQIGHRGEHNEENPDHYLTEIQIPVSKRNQK
ncbi:MerR family transcriptional regulator [Breznakia sp. OttesenSCG-928-G09]|nr:MerR family transcriptional regulator [Breznakia sp. OttesenSCG-928-G09]